MYLGESLNQVILTVESLLLVATGVDGCSCLMSKAHDAGISRQFPLQSSSRRISSGLQCGSHWKYLA